jgi:aryl-alcohol dehydrogenase-like predicted oxidoreductase
MLYRPLGRTDLNVSVIGIGTWQFGGEWGGAYTPAMVEPIFDAGRELGINLIDTAECYGDHVSESLIGAAIQRDRANWVVATKFGHKFNANFERTEPRAPKDVLEQCEASLRALRTDYIDLYQYHSWGDDDFFRDDVLAVLQTLKDEGKVRHVGDSVSKNDNVKQVGACRARGVEAVQIVYNRLQTEPEQTTFPICQRDGLGVLARVPLASGYLSGKYKPGHQFSTDEVRGKWHKPEDRDAKLREVERIGRDEVPAGTPMAQWALAWCLKNPVVSCVIPGCKSADQVRGNAAAIKYV